MRKWTLLAAALAGALSITACGDRLEDLTGLRQKDCAVQFFDSQNFQFNNANLIVFGPGKFSTLKNLPNTQINWRGQVKSMEIFQLTTFQTWSNENFQGTTKIYQAKDIAILLASVDDFGSMQLICAR